MNKVEEAILRLIYQKPFYGHFLKNMSRVYTERLPSAGVTCRNGSIKFLINPKFVEKLSDQSMMELMIHEAGHVLRCHLGVYGDTVSNKKMANIAMDMAINHECMTLVKEVNGCHAGQLDMEEQLDFLTYYEELNRRVDEDEDGNQFLHMDENGKIQDPSNMTEQQKQESRKQMLEDATVDSHESWGDMSQAEKEAMRRQVAQAAEDAKNSAGSMPGYMEQLLKEWRESRIEWEKELQRFVSKSVKVRPETSRKRRNKRFGLKFPGKKIKRASKVAVCIDTSGSIQQSEFTAFMSETKKIKELLNIDITVIQCDSDVQSVEPFSEDLTLKGGGGTQFMPALREAEKLGVDGIVYLTDGDNWDQLEPINAEILWVLTSEYNLERFKNSIYLKLDE